MTTALRATHTPGDDPNYTNADGTRAPHFRVPLTFHTFSHTTDLLPKRPPTLMPRGQASHAKHLVWHSRVRERDHPPRQPSTQEEGGLAGAPAALQSGFVLPS